MATLCLTFDNMGSALAVGQGSTARPGQTDVGPAGYPETLDLLASERDHDIRAAYICLLTAGFAHAGTATVVATTTLFVVEV